MDRDKIKAILDAVSRQEITTQAALELLKLLPYQELGFATVDLHRCLRQGLAEVIFCPGKTIQQICQLAKELKAHHSLVLASRITDEQAAAVLGQLEGAVYNELARMIVWGKLPDPDRAIGSVAIVTAGTGDLPVAEEAALVLQSAGVPVARIVDVGVAGIHRLLPHLEVLGAAAVLIVVAGMDGALPSVIAGLVEQPVIAVPTSIGYGTSLGGLAALLAMLNSCAAGLTCVNIDNGFGAATAALRVLRAAKHIGA